LVPLVCPVAVLSISISESLAIILAICSERLEQI
jgi:hypothetical protein